MTAWDGDVELFVVITIQTRNEDGEKIYLDEFYLNE